MAASRCYKNYEGLVFYTLGSLQLRNTEEEKEMRKSFLGVLALATALSGCANIRDARPNELGRGEYGLYRYPGGLPGVADSPPATWNLLTFNQLQYLDASCRVQMRGQAPDAAHSIGTNIGRNLPFQVLGSIVGALPFGDVISTTDAAISGAGNGTGGVIGSAIDRHATSNRTMISTCMQAAIAMAKSRDGALGGIAAIPIMDTVPGKPLRRPTAAEEVQGDSTPADDEDDRLGDD